MYTVVLTKGVPDFREGKVSFDEDGHLERGKTPTVMNPNDELALRAALQGKVRHGGTVSLLSMGPPGYTDVLRQGMEEVYADDLYLLSDREMAAADTWATAMTVTTGISRLEPTPDLVVAGFKTADGETGHTGPQTNWCHHMNDALPDRTLVTHVVSLDVDPDAGTLRAKRLVKGDVTEVETVETDLPAFVVTDPEFEASYPKADHRLRYKDLREETKRRAEDPEAVLTVWNHEDLNLDPDFIGLDGSPTIVAGVDPIPKGPDEREATHVSPDDGAGMETVLEELQPFAGGD
ncbi:electron transfer flavoprotein subunit beta/FixA family protein [Halorubrum sp. JWXQ-INN 858]|uniref:electron transfer flavoprotein subunit beta/FixA family protein n=1 Tax=Halorubrum sp. JWXQ-INN 858 TaxID=2690782 RepID=UPI001358BB78|nr:electron transfer flavoprotein subunit beta/FixA family protein [Halorubrum sp. JWXQ-INN 858]MWV64134.1 electron transfer flavoprotein subunit beta/FixA family protein [Halorubrum sp. JWXQ-INN 858]